MKNFIAIMALLAATSAWATTPRDQYVDNIANLSGGSLLAVPSAGAALVSDTSSVTLTNKSISGSTNTFSNIPTGAIASGFLLTVPNGGTGDTTFTSNGIPYGAGASALLVTAAGSQYQSLQAGSGGTPQFLAIQLAQSAAVSGQLAVANGGTGDATLTAHAVLIGAGTSAVAFAAPSTTGYVLTSTGASSDPTFQVIPSMGPTINGSAASPNSVTAAGGVVLTAPTYFNYAFVKGGTPSSTVTVTATPSITACTAAGQILYIVSESSTALFTLQNQADLAGSQVLLNGPWTSGENNSTPYTLTLSCDGAVTPNWVEVARNN